jgi:type I restriction enzyme S subunit
MKTNDSTCALPTTWVKTTIGDVYDVIGGGTPSTSVPEYWGGPIPWITSADIAGVRDIKIHRHVTDKGIRDSAANEVPARTLLVVTRVGLGKIAIAQQPICFSQDIQGLLQDPDLIIPEYGLHFLSFDLQRLKFEGRGTTISGLTKKQLKDVAFPLPPLNEQRRIVTRIEELLSELDSGIESLKIAREQTNVYRQSVLKHAFEGKLTAQWRERNGSRLEVAAQHLSQLAGGESTVSDSEREKLSKLPYGWTYIKLGQIIDEPKYGTSRKCDYKTEGIGVIRIPNIVSGVIDDSDLKFAQFDHDEIQAYQLRRGDILIVRSNGSISIVGRCAVVHPRDEKYLFAGYLLRIRPNAKIVDSEYLHSVLSCHALRVQIEAKAKSTSGVNNINSGELQSLIIPLCGIEEQIAILTRLRQTLTRLDQLEIEIDQQLKRADALRQSILKKAFSGRLVAQDAHDKPAAVLMERINGAKARNGNRKRRTNRRDAA